MQHKFPFFEAQEVMDLIAGFEGCSPDAKEKATAMRSELSALSDADQAKAAAEKKEKAENDARIQGNGLKMTDPKEAASLTRQEREEVYHRSLKAMGLDESGPLTASSVTSSIGCTALWFSASPANLSRNNFR
jgi:hypothetical protein